MKTVTMKSIICGLVMGLSLLTCSAYTEAEYRAEYEKILDVAKTNKTVAQKMFSTGPLIRLGYDKSKKSLASDVDEGLSEVGIKAAWVFKTDQNFSLTKMATLDFEYKNITSSIPRSVAVAQKYGISLDPMELNRTKEVSIEDCVLCLSDYMRAKNINDIINMSNINCIKRCIQNRGERVVRKYIRRQGKSFVTKNGVNPCLVYMQELNKALNAPRFNGLNEWLEKMGLTVRLDISGLLSEADTERLKTAILYADKDMTDSDKWMLQLCLGIDGYNAFVREFNGD